jgi:hypothetical protein
MMAEKIRPKDRPVHGGEEERPFKPLGVKLEKESPRTPRRNASAIGGSEAEVRRRSVGVVGKN